MRALLLLAVGLAGTEDPAVAFRRALFDFNQGEYKAVVQRLEPLLDPVQLPTEEDVVEARKTLGTVYFLLGQQQKARDQFELLLLTRPEATLDVYSTAPPVLRFFAEVKSEVANKGREVERVFADRKQHFEAPRHIERATAHHYEILAFLPFGIGQFQNGHIGLGLMFLALDLLGLGANVLGYIALQLNANAQGFLPNATGKQLQTTWNTVQYSGLGVFLAGWIAGAVHARWYFQPVVTIEREVVRPATSAVPGQRLNLGLSFGFAY